MDQKQSLVIGLVIGAILAFAAAQTYSGYASAAQFGMAWNPVMPSSMGQGMGNHVNGQCGTGTMGSMGGMMGDNYGGMMQGNQMNHEQCQQYMAQYGGMNMSSEQCQQMMSSGNHP